MMAKKTDGKRKILFEKDILERLPAGQMITMRELLRKLSEHGMAAERERADEHLMHDVLVLNAIDGSVVHTDYGY